MGNVDKQKIKRNHLRGGQIWRCSEREPERELKILSFGILDVQLNLLSPYPFFGNNIVKIKRGKHIRWYYLNKLLKDLNSGNWKHVSRQELALEKLKK